MVFIKVLNPHAFPSPSLSSFQLLQINYHAEQDTELHRLVSLL
jgi:hypothetical protein